MTRVERRNEKKRYGKDFANYCQIMKLYFQEYINWISGLKDTKKFWTYEIEVMRLTVIMKNVCCIGRGKGGCAASGSNTSGSVAHAHTMHRRGEISMGRMVPRKSR